MYWIFYSRSFVLCNSFCLCYGLVLHLLTISPAILQLNGYLEQEHMLYFIKFIGERENDVRKKQRPRVKIASQNRTVIFISHRYRLICTLLVDTYILRMLSSVVIIIAKWRQICPKNNFPHLNITVYSLHFAFTSSLALNCSRCKYFTGIERSKCRKVERVAGTTL